MERKRRLPPRAAARQEQAAKRRSTPRGSSTPAVVEPPREPTPPPPPPTPPPPSPPPLPTSIEVGQALPTVEDPQALNLSSRAYQSVSESGVMSESLSRSRLKWISEGLFEKFWAKPHKKKGVLQEDPNNPPKDSMMKVGTVTITTEPHIIVATMFAVKTSKLLPHQRERFQPKPEPQPQLQTQAQSQSQPQPPGQAQGQSTGLIATQITAQPSQPPVNAQETVKTEPSPVQQPHQPPQAAAATKTPQQSQVLARPVLQYGPPNGSMPPPPPPTPASATATPTPTSVGTPPATPNSTSSTAAPALAPSSVPTTSMPASTSATVPATSSASPALSSGAVSSTQAAVGDASTPTATTKRITASPSPGPANAAKSLPSSTPQPQAQQKAASGSVPRAVQPASAPQNAARPPSNPPLRQAVAPAPASAPASAARPTSNPHPTPSPASNKPAVPATPAPAAKPAANDPVIALLAQKASADPELRDLMKRVAVGQAKDGELAKFQKIIDQLNAEYRQRGGQQGPSADRLLVDGRTVKYFADEVRTILDIVLASNPNQKSSELRPPPRSDPLVVLLVKTALEDQRTKDMIRRIAEGKPGFTDATDLKQILDRLHRDAKIIPKGPPPPGPSPLKQAGSNGPPKATLTKAHPPQTAQPGNPQAIRSKGPPPSNRPDISAVLFDFGTGDRYLFPKFSILEFLPSKSGQQVVASFLIVRKGSASEYGGDPALDYYQPVTIRLQTQSGRHLENLARVVAPQDEVRRYMNDVMDNMTRAEYVLLAMRLPRADVDLDEEGGSVEDSKASSPTPKSEPETDQNPTPKPSLLWTTGSGNKAEAIAAPSMAVKLQDPEQEAQSKYERLIRSVAEREVVGVL